MATVHPQPSLPVPDTAAGQVGLAHICSEPRRSVVALDYDGTLAPIVADPNQAHAHPGATAALQTLAPRVGSLAIITGRPAADVPQLGSFTDVTPLVVLGGYGRQRWENGVLTQPEDSRAVARARTELPELLAAAPEGTWLEDKGQALAVHTRRTADPPAVLAALEPVVRELAARLDLVVEPGRMVLELRPPGEDKGTALRELVTRIGATSVLYAGDDLGDLAAFDAVAELRMQGVSALTVCSGSTEMAALAQRADLVVDGPAGVVALLTALGVALVS